MPELVIKAPKEIEQVIDLVTGTYNVGRNKGNDIVLSDKMVSRFHAKIVYDQDDATFTIEDLKSQNGVYINDKKIYKVENIEESDTIRIGETIITTKGGIDDSKTLFKELSEIKDGTGTILLSADRDSSQERPILILYDPTGKRRKIELSIDGNRIGKSKRNDIVLRDRTASRKHAFLSYDNSSGHFLIEDLKSKSGVYLNKKRIRGKEVLNFNDEIRIGATVMEFKKALEEGAVEVHDTPMVILDNATKVYKLGQHEVQALNGVNFTVLEGEFTSVVGPSGSGKSTLLNLIGCIDTPTSGSVTIMGRDVATYKDAALSRLRNETIGFIFQSFNLVPVLNAFENVEYPLVILGVSKAQRLGKTSAILNEVGLEEFAKHRPEELSGGQRQRVAIARALVTEPEIVLADEPTANLDSKTGFEILDLMKKLNEEHRTTFIFSTHDPKIEKYAKNIYTMKDGKLIQ